MLVAEENIFCNRQQRHQRQFLMDDDDADFFAVGDAVELPFLPFEMNLAGVGPVRIDTAQHFHQGGFSGAVFADHGVDFAVTDRQVDIV